MEQTFLTKIYINKVRHLRNIKIPLSKDTRKHLILTGKNGSGKTSVLDGMAYDLQLTAGRFFQDTVPSYNDDLKVSCHYQPLSYATLPEKYSRGEFLIAYYKADRFTKADKSDSIETVHLENVYSANDTPGRKLVKYMVGLKATQAFALQKNDVARSSEIEKWFLRFEGILKKIFDDPSLTLDFDIDNFTFRILQTNREPFDFNTMSSGYSAVFNIINDLIMRMEKHKTMDMEGIALIDEIDTHLHLELQRTILPFLTELFPNIQFIVTTHSPFILNSVENAVIFDLETGTLVENGLKNYPYDGIVESYFNTDHLSAEVRDKLNRYKALAEKSELTDRDWAEIAELECTLDEIPDFLSPKIAEEYNRLQLELSNRR